MLEREPRAVREMRSDWEGRSSLDEETDGGRREQFSLGCAPPQAESSSKFVESFDSSGKVA